MRRNTWQIDSNQRGYWSDPFVFCFSLYLYGEKNQNLLRWRVKVFFVYLPVICCFMNYHTLTMARHVHPEHVVSIVKKLYHHFPPHVIQGYKSHKIFDPVIEWLYFSISWENKWSMLDFVFFQHVSMGNINWVLFLFARRRRHSNRLLICWKYRNSIECWGILWRARISNEMSVYIQFSLEFICRELEV